MAESEAKQPPKNMLFSDETRFPFLPSPLLDPTPPTSRVTRVASPSLSVPQLKMGGMLLTPGS